VGKAGRNGGGEAACLAMAQQPDDRGVIIANKPLHRFGGAVPAAIVDKNDFSANVKFSDRREYAAQKLLDIGALVARRGDNRQFDRLCVRTPGGVISV
jgi:hypothetical protein